jgi:hypothetical protein
LLAGSLPGRATAVAADLNLEQLQTDFNKAAGEARIIVLLSPT